METYKGFDQFNCFPKSNWIMGQKNVKVIFIGNSITFHGPAPEIGWMHSHGIASSQKNNDYVHVLLELLNIEETSSIFRNYAEFERVDLTSTAIWQEVQEFLSSGPDLTVIQLSDNVTTNEELRFFHSNLRQICSLAKIKSKQTVLLSSWWASEPKDHVVSTICSEFELTYVFIGDLFLSPDNEDRRCKSYEHEGVDRHPQDWGMRKIAQRIYNAIAIFPN